MFFRDSNRQCNLKSKCFDIGSSSLLVSTYDPDNIIVVKSLSGDDCQRPCFDFAGADEAI